jgi:hypothetical protein
MKIDGGCHCGAIAYEAEVDPDRVGICHCTDCQQLTGTAFSSQRLRGGRGFSPDARHPEDLHQDSGEREQAGAGLLRRLRIADLRDVGRRGRPEILWHPRRHGAPACRTQADTPGLAPLGAVVAARTGRLARQREGLNGGRRSGCLFVAIPRENRFPGIAR